MDKNLNCISVLYLKRIITIINRDSADSNYTHNCSNSSTSNKSSRFDAGQIALVESNSRIRDGLKFNVHYLRSHRAGKGWGFGVGLGGSHTP